MLDDFFHKISHSNGMTKNDLEMDFTLDFKLKVKGHLQFYQSILSPSLAMSRVNVFTKLIDSVISHLLPYFGLMMAKNYSTYFYF